MHESERGPFVREAEKRDEKRLGDKIYGGSFAGFFSSAGIEGSQRTGKCMYIKVWRNKRNFTDSTKLRCGRGKAPCFAVCALVCDFSPKVECVLAITINLDRKAGQPVRLSFRLLPMLRDFEAELSDLTEIISQDQQELGRISRETINAEKFLALVRKYTDFSELTPAVINEFVEKILVHQAQGKGASRTQEIEIFFNFIGKVDIPHKEVELTEEEKAALAEQERRRAKKQNTIRRYMEKKRRQWKEQLSQLTF